MKLLIRSSLRFYLRHPAQAALALAGIGLGVAVFVGVTLAIDSATRAFDQSAQFVRGQTTHRLLPVGRDLEDRTYVELVRTRALVAAPVLEADVRVDDPEQSRTTLLGVDPIEEAAFRDFTRFAPSGGDTSIDRLLLEPATALMATAAPAAATARLRIVTEIGVRELELVGTLAAEAGDLIVTDISTAQEVTGRIGRLSRIDLILTEPEAQVLAAALPAATVLVSASNENAAFLELSRAFAINVSALGLLAVVVGAFLIYSTMAFAVVQRHTPFAVLRALGVTELQIAQVLAIEALVIGLIGAGLGTALGAVLADQLVAGVAATIDDFAFRSAVAVTRPTLWLYAQGMALGLFATLAAATWPVLDAVRIDPTTAMRRTAQERLSARRIRQGPRLAIVMSIIAASLLLLPTRSLPIAFAGLACVLAAGALVAPAAIVALARALEPACIGVGGIYGRMAIRNVAAHQSRIAVAAAALTIAVATVIGIGLMIGSFRVSLVRWLDTTLTSDVFVTGDRPFDSTEIVATLQRRPEIVGVSETRFVELPSRFGAVGIRALAPASRGWGLHVVDGNIAAAIEALDAGTHVAISEPFAYRHELARGDRLALPTPAGPRDFAIAGIYRDYNAGGAAVLMPLPMFREHWGDAQVHTLGLELSAALDTGELEALLATELAGTGFRVTRADRLKGISLQIFDRTFAITSVLRTLAGLVAFLGMLSALLAIQLERQREIATLRALGFAPRGLRILALTETTLTGAAAGLAAIPIGIALAGLLVFVINERSFGWTMELSIAAGPLVAGLAIAVGAALLAGIVPGLVGRTSINSAALQYE